MPVNFLSESSRLSPENVKAVLQLPYFFYWDETGNTQIILLGLTYILNFKVDLCQEFSGKELEKSPQNRVRF